MNMLYNDRFAAVIANRGEGFTALSRCYVCTVRYFDSELYLPRDLEEKSIYAGGKKIADEVIPLTCQEDILEVLY